MRSILGVLAIGTLLFAASCAKRESAEGPAATETAPPVESAQTAQPASGPRALIRLTSGKTMQGVIVASTSTEMVVVGDDGIEAKIPLGQVKAVEYTDANTVAQAERPAQSASARTKSPASAPARQQPEPQQQASREPDPESSSPLAPAPPPPTPAPTRAVTTKTYELPAGSQVSVRVNEAIDSQKAADGQTFDAQVTRDATDVNGDVVIPRGASANVVIRSASQGGRIRGASDLVLDLQSVTIGGQTYTLETADVTKKGDSGVGANKRTATYTGGGAAVGAIIGAIAGGGKGAAIGAGAGAGAGALTQVLTRGRNIKVPAESVLTFRLDQPLKVTSSE